MPLFDNLDWTSAGGEVNHRLTPAQQLGTIGRLLGEPDMSEARLLRLVAGAPDDAAAQGLLSAMRALGVAGHGGAAGPNMEVRPQDMGDQVALLQGAMAAPAQGAAPAPAAPAAPVVPGAPPLGQGRWDGNSFMPPTDPPREGMAYPRRSPEGFLPGRVPAAMRQPPLPDHYGGGLLQRMRAVRPRLLR